MQSIKPNLPKFVEKTMTSDSRKKRDAAVLVYKTQEIGATTNWSHKQCSGKN